MKTTIDAAGRLVVPKFLRERFQFVPGGQIEIEPVADGVLIRPVGSAPSLVDRDGVLVHHGPGHSEIDIAGFVRQQRHQRAGWLGAEQA